MVAAQHLAVGLVGGTALAPGRHVVGVHLGDFVDTGAVAAALNGTVWAVAHAICLGGLSLFLINAVDNRLVTKEADIQQTLVLLTTQDVFKDAFLVFDIVICIQFMHSL